MTVVDFLHHENSPSWTEVEPTILGAEGLRQTNHATQPAPVILLIFKFSHAVKLEGCSIIFKIIGRLECGRTQLEVSEELGIGQSVISRLWQRFQDDGNVSRCYSTGCPRVTTPNEDRYLVTAKRNRRSTASDLSR
ncbi:transposable element Tcb1 transposase [Trichonephila clavipes]|nr:transposable element Tcb1 transposase [Trichonephila clavipes]